MGPLGSLAHEARTLTHRRLCETFHKLPLCSGRGKPPPRPSYVENRAERGLRLEVRIRVPPRAPYQGRLGVEAVVYGFRYRGEQGVDDYRSYRDGKGKDDLGLI